ncbi:MAG: T9SS type A sorting domain-containing protein [Bacteroidota bacterium]
MKKIYALIFILCVSLSVYAQPKRAVLSKSLQNRAVLSPKYNGQAELPVLPSNGTVANKSVADDVIGDSRYDNQCNGSLANRLFLWPDNSISAAWMRGTDDASGYADRGTGYNYYNGTAWNAAPTQRVETVRTGWPSLNAWMGNGEITFAHNSTATLIMNTRPVKGTGNWTQSTLPTGPTGVTTLLWPSVMTNGSTHQFIHVLAIGQPSYQGMSDALLYFRSLDGGVTWDKHGVVLPGMTATDELGYAGDDYTWAAPKGDTIAFVVAGNWEDGFVMKSFDNGSTWTKTVFYNNPYKVTPVSTVVPTFWCLDGSTAIQLDNAGKAHVAAGRMRANGDGSSRFYFPGTDGLIYWNENMPVIDTTRLSNLDTLEAHGQLVGYVAADAAGDSIVGFPLYGTGLSSFPRIVIDQFQNVYFLWAGLTVGNPDPTPFNYRHIWGRVKKPSLSQFYPMIDLNSDFLYIFQEFVYPSAVIKTSSFKIESTCQTASQPGSNIQDATVPVHDVSFAFRELDCYRFFPYGIKQNAAAAENKVSAVFPNPVTRSAQFSVSISRPGSVQVTVTDLLGQNVLVLDKGVLQAGAHKISLDCSGLGKGVYVISVDINGERFAQRMVKE